jgi:hypothetical protein
MHYPLVAWKHPDGTPLSALEHSSALRHYMRPSLVQQDSSTTLVEGGSPHSRMHHHLVLAKGPVDATPCYTGPLSIDRRQAKSSYPYGALHTFGTIQPAIIPTLLTKT